MDRTNATAGNVRATAHGLADYLARINDYLPPGTNPRPKERDGSAHSKPASRPNLNIDAYDLIALINDTTDTAARLARIALRTLDGEGWDRPDDHPLAHVGIYADALQGRDDTALQRLADTLDGLHARAERYLGITDPPVPLDLPCPDCGGRVLRHARDAVAWCTDKTWHEEHGIVGRWDGIAWLGAHNR